ncbi:hypothetical protein [Sorangium sp. So ce131]|uniref:hypothetical protein n=1 Tax=Sorangium sp. So ce131 TaxID=3133282 RepID=UPI003F6234A3
MSDLLKQLRAGRADGSYDRRLARFVGVDLLVIDDFDLLFCLLLTTPRPSFSNPMVEVNMSRTSSFHDLFRFIQLRPPVPPRSRNPAPLVGATQLAARLRTARGAEARQKEATLALQRGVETVREATQLPGAATVLVAIEALREQPGATTTDLITQIGDIGSLQIENTIKRLSDTLLASVFATHDLPEDLRAMQDLYRVYHFLQSNGSSIALSDLLRRPLLTPFSAAYDLDEPYGASESPLASAPGAGGGKKRAPLRIRPVGVADLLVVRKQVKRYEAGEIAHIENVLSGEKKLRSHRLLERSEETLTTETEKIREQTHELETADRFELNRETSETLRQEQHYGVDLSLSIKYGKMIEFSSDFEMDVQKSQEQSSKNAAQFAHDVVERSIDRITQKVSEQRTRKMILETEETNQHEADNKTGAHVRGVYQFIDKIYEAQVFNYGVRAMFDFMVPEPASFLLHTAAGDEAGPRIPSAPKPYKPTFVDLENTDTWQKLVSDYGALDVVPPPEEKLLLTTGFMHPLDGEAETGNPRSVARLEVVIPPGYRAVRAKVLPIMLSDHMPGIGVTIGEVTKTWTAGDDEFEVVGGEDNEDNVAKPTEGIVFDLPKSDLAPEGKLDIGIVAWQSHKYSIQVTIECERNTEGLNAWKSETVKKIHAAYLARVDEWEQKVNKVRAEARARENAARQPFGTPPQQNRRTILQELKKHCISIITEQRFEGFDATKPGNPPFFDFTEARIEGSFIRFFEQAFEWDQMQYVFYPYFWARRSTWDSRVESEEPDPEFRDFLQAGAARVVVPVRRDFETAVTHYLETGKLWSGSGEPPQIQSPLYLSIIDEIRERSGAAEEETPVNEPWEIRVPTPLVYLRGGDGLPKWQRVAEDKWEWIPVEEEP